MHRATVSIIECIVDRCHVGMSDLSVIRYLLSRLVEGRKTFFGFNRRTRHAWIRAALQQHHRNQNLYHRLMTGRL